MDPKEFGEYLAELRIKAGYKRQAALSRKSGVSPSTIARLERGTTRPDYDTLFKLAPFLGISVNTMLEKLNSTNDEEPKIDSTKYENRLAEIVADLPEEAQKSLEDFIEFLYIKHNLKPKLNRK